MKISNTHKKISNKKLILLVCLLVSGAIAISVIYLFINRPTPIEQDNDIKDNASIDTNSTQNSTNSPNESPKTPIDNQPSDQKDSGLLATITYIRQEDSLLKIGVDIEVITSSGECTLNLSKDEKKVDYSVGIQPLASSSTCKGFEIPIIELSPGNWKISIVINSGDKSTTLTDNVIIE